MSQIFNGIAGIIVVIVIIFGFIIILQFLSKISGKGIRQKGQRSTTIDPDDFDNTVEVIKNTSVKVTHDVMKMGKSQFDKILFDIDHTLKSKNLKFSKFLYYLNKLIKHDEECNRRNRFSDGQYAGDYSSEGVNLRAHVLTFRNIFNEKSVNKVIQFFTGSFSLNESQIIEIIDNIGGENIENLCKIIDKVQILNIKSKLTDNEIKNIKKYILNKIGVLDKIIFRVRKDYDIDDGPVYM